MTAKPRSPIAQWEAKFEQDPFGALDHLLTGRVYMGQLNRNDTDEILFRLFHVAPQDHRAALDRAMRSWFAGYLGDAPSSIPTARWDEILRDALSAVVRVDLRDTQVWLLENYVPARVYLRSLYLGPDRDPEADLLRTLALCQRDQRLLPLWMSLCRMEEDRPLHFASLGLLGLRKLPDESGDPPGDLHPAVFRGIVDLANAIAEQVRPKKEGEAFWSLKVRALMARHYPRSSRYWIQHFLPVLYLEPSSTAATWLGKLTPRLRQVLDGKATVKKTTRGSLRPPSREELETILELLTKRRLHEIRSDLVAFLGKHREYAYQTGYAEFLVKTLGNVSYRISRQDPDWALELLQEAFVWAPYSPHLWTQRATIESYLGRDVRAVGLLWEAKRKFPENSHIRNILGNLLLKQGKEEIAEGVYRQAVEDFPDNPFCRNGLADVLKAQERFEDAEEVYRQTVKHFPRDAYARSGLADVLKAQERFEDAEGVYRQAVKDFPDDSVCRSGLAEVLRAQGRFEDAEGVYRQAVKEFPDDPFCRNGLAVIWLRQGKRSESVRLLQETVKQFNDPVARALLESLKESQEDLDAIEVAYEELRAPMVQPEQRPSIEERRPLQEPGVDSEQKRERERADIVESDDAFPVPSSTFAADGDGMSETYIGLANLYRLAARRAEGEEKERYERGFAEACQKALTDSPNNVFALLEQGFWMLDDDPEEAKAFFAERIHNGKRSHVLGFHMGHLQSRVEQGETVARKEWKALRDMFPNRRTLIMLANVSAELCHVNGTLLPLLDMLRRQMRADLEALPIVLRENEKWLRSTAERRLFTDIDLSGQFTEEVVQTVSENAAKSDLTLRGTLEQSLASGI